MNKESPFKCCAACIHFRAYKNPAGGMKYMCSRLGFETRPEYSFDCFTPKENVIKLMKKRGIN
ncbi:hypothetical protein [Metabacillus sp. RGM 3146]|uniref:hypothetical protein n=1 Tax=Metabacillus sp. RGM 3146 TaxID=3401092 RepID=UPI003B9B9B77